MKAKALFSTQIIQQCAQIHTDCYEFRHLFANVPLSAPSWRVHLINISGVALLLCGLGWLSLPLFR